MLIDADEIRSYYPDLLAFALRRHQIAGRPSGVEPADWVHHALVKLSEQDKLPCSTKSWLMSNVFQASTNEIRSLKRRSNGLAALQENVSAINAQKEVEQNPERVQIATQLVRRVLSYVDAVATAQKSAEVLALLEVYRAGIFLRGDVVEILEIVPVELDRRRASLRRMLGKLPSGLESDIVEFLDVTK